MRPLRETPCCKLPLRFRIRSGASFLLAYPLLHVSQPPFHQNPEFETSKKKRRLTAIHCLRHDCIFPYHSSQADCVCLRKVSRVHREDISIVRQSFIGACSPVWDQYLLVRRAFNTSSASSLSWTGNSTPSRCIGTVTDASRESRHHTIHVEPIPVPLSCSSGSETYRWRSRPDWKL